MYVFVKLKHLQLFLLHFVPGQMTFWLDYKRLSSIRLSLAQRLLSVGKLIPLRPAAGDWTSGQTVKK